MLVLMERVCSARAILGPLVASYQAEDLDKGLARAVRESRQVFQRDGSWKKGPFLIADNVSKGAFEIWADKQDGHWRLAWEPSQLEEDCPEGSASGIGFCWMYGDSDEIHELTLGHISMEMPILLNEMGARPHVRFTHSARRQLIRRQKEPDWSMVPKDEPFGANPSVVFEVSYRNESFAELKREIQEWVEGSGLARLAIGINIIKKEPSRRKPRRLKLQAFWMRSGDQTISPIMDFSTGDNDFNIRIRVEDIFGGEKPGVQPFLDFNLQPLQVELRRLLNII